jgi:prepilin-type N-terminal cleavage/methylation domain-containing protein/prepilin-type processing-associated H-X9-DG protein
MPEITEKASKAPVQNRNRVFIRRADKQDTEIPAASGLSWVCAGLPRAWTGRRKPARCDHNPTVARPPDSPDDGRDMKSLHRVPSGFTLLEVLVTAGLVLILALAGAGACRNLLNKRARIQELAAGKNLITAYLAHAADNDGRYLPGMDFSMNKVAFPPENRDVTVMHAANRYPFRLAPYFEYRLDGTILLGGNRKHIGKLAKPGTPMFDYIVSAFPAFGINYYFVGGCVTGVGGLTYPDECVTRASQGAGRLLVFASGGATDGITRVEGFNILTPPQLYGPAWSQTAWKKNSDPGLYGNVDARHDGKAVCVFLDGSIRLLDIEELRDMRLWNRHAAEQDNPGYTIPL